MIIKTQEDVTPVVVDAYKNIGDARLREIVASLVKHLHAFARDVHLTEEEFQAGTQIIAKMGQMSNATHNEVVLMSGSLGFSALVCLLNNGNNGQTETTANLLGPFWRLNSPRTENGGSIIRSPTPGPALFVNAWVKDTKGQSDCRRRGRHLAFLAGGLLRAAGSQAGRDEFARQIHHRRQGHFGFRSVKPAGYPIPIDGPVGDLLRAANRHNFRPAHLHFLILKEGFKTLISQIYVPDDPKAGDRCPIRGDAGADWRLCPARWAGARAGREGRVVFAGSDLRNGAGQKPAAKTADPIDPE